MPPESAATFRPNRAPQEDGQTLIEPPWFDLPAVVAKNRERIAAIECHLLGRPIAEISASARERLIETALEYTRNYRSVPNPQSERSSPAGAGNRQSLPVILSGHQPQLYHSGVWYKNFVLGALAKHVEGIGIHLLIDSDLCRNVSIRVPTGAAGDLRVETMSYDRAAADIPFEERPIRDGEAFQSFGRNIAETIAPLVDRPLVTELWPLVTQRSRHEKNLGLCLAQGRHMLEAAMGNETVELPQSAICQFPEFAWFVLAILADLPRFQTAYNASLTEYRTAHHVRNRAHPVPDLTRQQDGWLEAPFWIWSAENPTRRPLFARRNNGGIELNDGQRERYALEFNSDGDAFRAVDQLVDLLESGIKIRTRTLTTTLFARLILGDIFLHGIGGAKYDQVTNLIARTFFGIELPEFAAVSATLQLPIQRANGTPIDANLPQRLRELQFHPEQFLEIGNRGARSAQAEVEQHIAAKRRWVSTPTTPQNAHERHQAIGAANAALQPYLQDLRTYWQQQLRDQEAARPAAAIVASREYSFCLQPRVHFERMLLEELG